MGSWSGLCWEAIMKIKDCSCVLGLLILHAILRKPSSLRLPTLLFLYWARDVIAILSELCRLTYLSKLQSSFVRPGHEVPVARDQDPAQVDGRGRRRLCQSGWCTCRCPWISKDLPVRLLEEKRQRHSSQVKRLFGVFMKLNLIIDIEHFLVIPSNSIQSTSHQFWVSDSDTPIVSLLLKTVDLRQISVVWK